MSSLQDSLSSAPSAASSSMKSTDLSRMAIPAVLPKPKNTTSVSMFATGDTSSTSTPASSVAFKLLSRDAKGRVEARQLLVPQTSTMAVKLQKAEEEMKIEKQRLKERVLQIESLVAEAEFEEANNLQFFNSRGRSDKTILLQAGESVQGRSAPVAVQQVPPQQQLSISQSTSSHSQPQARGGYGKYHRPVKIEETRKPADSLNLDEFLAESSAAEMRRMKK
mmetsp:Transcript_4127/g.5698  ORF Transcript_4127/g.5698 Transcript_4127/m.5698 type:complete len:222 (-) Transcript_4127:109-774(-)